MVSRLLVHTSLLVLIIIASSALQAKEIRIISRTAGGANFCIRILEEIVALKGEYALVYPFGQQDRISLDKTLADFESGELDVLWTLSSREYEEKYQAVYYPLYLGMFGMRVPIVAERNRNILSEVRDINDLLRYEAGQGRKWADTLILEHNDIPLVKVSKYASHFPMLDGGRFDYFPRAIHEPWGEIVQFSEYELVVDEHVLIRYRVPYYFFVSKENKELQRYLSEGMEALSRSGRHRELFFQEEDVRLAINNSNLSERVVIDLENPELTRETPVERRELWFDPINDETPW